MAKLGDLNIRLVLDIVLADKDTQKFVSSLKSVDIEADKASASTERLTTQSVRLSEGIQNVGLRVNGFQAVLSTLQQTFGNFIQSYIEQEVALAKLENGLKNVGEGVGALERLSKQAGDLQKITPFTDEEINNAQAMLTTFHKNSQEIEMLTPRMLDLAAAYMKSGESGMDLQQIAVLLGKVNEDSIGMLRRVGVALSKAEEEKLKSLRGTEQMIYLAEILDSNFKGMAETIGNTTAGALKTFRSQAGELKEVLGKMLVEVLFPILAPLKSLVEYLINAGPVVHRLTLGVIALGVAFQLLGTSMGGLPFIIGGIITALYALGAVGVTTAGQLRALNEETLRSKEVSAEMREVLDELKISANNMAEAYDGIANAIGSMTRTQLLSTKAFIAAEKAKLQALIESTKAMKLQELAGMDFVPPDAGASYERTLNIGFSADLQKFDELIQGIDAKLKFTIGETETTGAKTTGNTAKDKIQKTKEFLTHLQELQKQLDAINEKIGKQTLGESTAEGLFIKKKSIEDEIELIRAVNTDFAEYIRLRSELATLPSAPSPSEIKLIPEDEMLKFRIMLQERQRADEQTEKTFSSMVSNLQASERLVSQVASKLPESGKTFLGYIMAALQTAIQIAGYIQKSQSKGGASFFDFLPILGSLIGFLPGFAKGTGSVPDTGSPGKKFIPGFAKGTGSVPDTGSPDPIPEKIVPGKKFIPGFAAGTGSVPRPGPTDTVLAWLTPGEGVLNRSAMSEIGSGFVNWLNKGGSLSSILTPQSSVSGINNQVVINLNGELTDHLSHKIVSNGNLLVNVRKRNSDF